MTGTIVYVSKNSPKRGMLSVKQEVDGLIFENTGWIESTKKLRVGDTIAVPDGAILDTSSEFNKWSIG